MQFVLDHLSIAVVSGASLTLFLLVPSNDDGSIDGGPGSVAVVLFVAVVSIVRTLWVWVWCRRPLRDNGQTHAMTALGLRIEKMSGEPLTFWALFVRMLFLMIDAGVTPFIGWITIAASTNKQRVGDMAAMTIVTRTD